MKNKIDDGRNYTGVVKRLTIEIQRPDNTTAYTLGDCVNNLTAQVKKVDTITLTGSSGTSLITGAGNLSKTLTYATSKAASALAFKTANAADYLDVDIVLTNSGDTLIFTAKTEGVSFVSPVITNVTGDVAGTVVNTTANATYQIQELADAVLFEGGSGVIQDVILEINDITAAYLNKTFTLNIYDTAVTPVADNAAFLNLYDNKDKLVAKIDVTTAAAVVANSTSVVRQAAPAKHFVCASDSKSLYAVLQTPALTPVASVKHNITLLVKQL